MTGADREALISGFEHAYEPLQVLVAGLSGEQLAFVPNLQDAWSINEHLVHLLDADCNLVFRVRGGIATPGLPAPAWDQEAWKERNAYGKSDGRAALTIAAALRTFIAGSLRAISGSAWEEAHIIHSKNGKMSLVQLLETYTKHAAWHETYLRRNLDAWASDASASDASASDAQASDAGPSGRKA